MKSTNLKSIYFKFVDFIISKAKNIDENREAIS